jgi:hypothetical protein
MQHFHQLETGLLTKGQAFSIIKGAAHHAKKIRGKLPAGLGAIDCQ